MRFMVQVRATEDSEAGVMPPPEMFEEMGRFNEELIAKGYMLAGEGLKDSSFGARLNWQGDKVTVVDGPFAETKELIAGFWLVDIPSLAEAIEIFKKCPAPMPGKTGTLEIRQVFESADFEGVASQEMLDKEDAFRKAAGQAGRG